MPTTNYMHSQYVRSIKLLLNYNAHVISILIMVVEGSTSVPLSMNCKIYAILFQLPKTSVGSNAFLTQVFPDTVIDHAVKIMTHEHNHHLHYILNPLDNNMANRVNVSVYLVA